ncbi:ABC transporter ATP-binding protein [Candidatus Saccharibacteria bacterium oral taxon 488]|jgi:polysaccharide ABC transporter ATP-binding protein|nr:ABC transporter ATP-binding protein [Candidatus Saccharibacteria bacterium oral taxon 488]QJU10541.1 ABC transporter ATP-binding protein [Candidatus Saccharibacteria bacterium oral taxon 488]
MDDIAVAVNTLTKTFKIPTEASNGIKQKTINYLKGKKGYREFTPLKDISFEIKKGEFFGIVGKNGSGKSTLLKSIAQIYTPTGGSVQVNGSLVPFIELGVGFNPELTGRENIFLNGALLGFSHKEMELMYDDIVEFSELADFMEEKLKNYSSGMQVRLAFSVAIKARGDILMLDEVLAVGDAAFQQKCFDYFEKVKRSGQTVVFVTHDMNAVRRFCSRAMYIESGRIKHIGSPQEIADLYTEINIETITKAEEESQDDSVEMIVDLPDKKSFTQKETLDIGVIVDGISEDLFVNISFVYGGFVFADRNCRDTPQHFIKNGREINFKQQLDCFNPGRYDIHISLHRRIDDGIVKHLPRAFSFVIKGKDKFRDGPMKLLGEWKLYEGR